MATTYSAEEPDRLRGPQHDGAWIDELAAFSYPSAVDNLLFGLRLGDDPRLCVTTTPRPVRLVTELVADPTTAIARGTTYENRAHLASSFFERIVDQIRGDPAGPAGAAGGDPRGERRCVVQVVRRGPPRDRGGPNTCRVSPCTWRSTAGCRGTWRRCGSR